jgi:hypothetical protein
MSLFPNHHPDSRTFIMNDTAFDLFVKLEEDNRPESLVVIPYPLVNPDDRPNGPKWHGGMSDWHVDTSPVNL